MKMVVLLIETEIELMGLTENGVLQIPYHHRWVDLECIDGL